MVRFIVNILSNYSFKHKTSDGRCSRMRRSRNCLAQGSSLSHLLLTSTKVQFFVCFNCENEITDKELLYSSLFHTNI